MKTAPRSTPYWLKEATPVEINIKWHMIPDPNPANVKEKIVECIEAHTVRGKQSNVFSRHYDIVPVRAASISKEGCTYAQAVETATARGFIPVPAFLDQMVCCELGVTISHAHLVVIVTGDGLSATSALKVPPPEVSRFMSDGHPGEKMFDAETVFLFLCKR